MTPKNYLRRNSVISVIVLAAMLTSAAVRAQTAAATKPQRSDMRSQADADNKQAVLDRRELVLPVAKNFRPEPAAHKIRLQLKVEKTRLRLGEPIRYRLEIINIDSKPYVFNELSPSFFKSGRLPNDRISLVAKEPAGREIDIKSPLQAGDDIGGKEREFPSGWSDAEKSNQASALKRQARAEGYLLVKLEPGEILQTRGDIPGGAFRTLLTRYKFREPGTYELHAVLDGLLKAGTSSNSVRITISR